MMNKFYKITKGIKKSDTVHLSPKSGYSDDADINRILRMKTPLILENRFEVGTGKKFYDLVRFMDAGNFAISDKVKLLLKENNVSGWDCFPIIIENHEEKKYSAFQLSSNIAGKILNLEQLNNYEEDFIKFDQNTWDGSDLFTLENTAVLVCTQRVKDVLEEGKVTNIEFTPVEAV